MRTDNYIKMCEQAEEIQKLKPYRLTSTHLKGNIFICTDKETANYFWIMEQFMDVGDEVGSSVRLATKNIWLPTQEQLQEMVEAGCIAKLLQLVEFTRTKAFYRSRPFESLNELWLAFVMKEKYHKIWTGKKWVKEGGQSNNDNQRQISKLEIMIENLEKRVKTLEQESDYLDEEELKKLKVGGD